MVETSCIQFQGGSILYARKEVNNDEIVEKLVERFQISIFSWKMVDKI